MRRMTIPGIVVLFLVTGGVGFLLGNAGQAQLRRDNLKLRELNRELEQKAGTAEVALFFSKTTPTEFYLQPFLYRVKSGGEKHRQALEALFEGPPADSDLIGVFPKGTTLLGLDIKGGLAVVNLNHRAAELNVGARGEELAVASIVNTLTKFPDVYRVKILIEGKEVESLAGHLDLTGEFRYSDQVVRD